MCSPAWVLSKLWCSLMLAQLQYGFAVAAGVHEDLDMGSQHRPFRCGPRLLPALPRSALPAAVQSADVAMGLHGAHMTNALFMRPGAASETGSRLGMLGRRDSQAPRAPLQHRPLGWACMLLAPPVHPDQPHGKGGPPSPAFRPAALPLARTHTLALATAPHAMPPPVFEVFSAGWAWQLHRMWLDVDKQSVTQWWGLTIEVRVRVRVRGDTVPGPGPGQAWKVAAPGARGE